jgi:predicted transposase YbfD/YdcC
MDVDADTILDEEIRRARLGLLLKHFSQLDDAREPWRILYPLHEVLLLVTCATIPSCDDFDDIVPGANTISPSCGDFRSFTTPYPASAGCAVSSIGSIRPCAAAALKIGLRHCGPTGMSSLRSTARRRAAPTTGARGSKPSIRSVLMPPPLTLAQLCVPEKTNEITAIPDLLDQLAGSKQLEGALVTIDASGCEVEIADKIVAHKADYLLALKGNQPTLEADVEDYFRTAPAAETVTKTTLEKGHGRIETRAYTASSVVDWILSDRAYPGQPRFANIKTML